MTVTFTDLGATTLNGSITNSALTLTIPSGDVSKFPSSGNFYISVDTGANIELMIVTAGQGTATWTVTRGISPTTPVGHNNTAPITEIVGAATLTSFVQTPMTAAGQIIAGGASGAPVAVAAPTASTQVVSAVNGAPFLSAPSAPSLATATTGGTVAGGVYQCELSLVNAQGETVASASASITTTGSTSTITVTSPAAAGSGTQAATGYYAYMTQAGGSTYTRQQTAGSPTAIGTNLVISAPPTSGGLNPPGSNTAGTLIPGWATAASGSSTLASDTDVSISSPVDRSQLQYQTSDSKWHNVAGGMVKLAETVVTSGSPQATVTLTPVSGYRHLLIEWACQTDQTSAQGLFAQLNGDTAAHYDSILTITNVAGASVQEFLAQTSAYCGTLPANTAGLVGMGKIEIPYYANTIFAKTLFGQTGRRDGTASGNVYVAPFSSFWRTSSSAITSIVLMSGVGNILNGIFTLYGIV